MARIFPGRRCSLPSALTQGEHSGTRPRSAAFLSSGSASGVDSGLLGIWLTPRERSSGASSASSLVGVCELARSGSGEA